MNHRLLLAYTLELLIYVSRINELDPDCFLTAPALASQAGFEKAKVILDLLTHNVTDGIQMY